MPRMFILLLISLMPCGFVCAGEKFREITDPAEAAKEPDFKVQGEYIGEGTWVTGDKTKVGAQVIAVGEGRFVVVVTKGGLPGAGWKRDGYYLKTFGFRKNGKIVISNSRPSDSVRRKPGVSGSIDGDRMTLFSKAGDKLMELKPTVRHSPTEGAKPPKGAVVLFDGKNADNFIHGKMSKDNNLISNAETKQKFDDYTLHLEFRLSYMPEAQGQARSNSGLYLHDCYEAQILDSFGLEGENNECGGFYQLRKPDVNMCFPPLTWQTYDVEFIAPRYKDGKKISDARVEVRHNGVVIHPEFALEHATPGRQKEGPAPRPFYLQGHGNKVHYRNIWLAPKSKADDKAEKKMDLSEVRKEMMEHFAKLQVEGKTYGCYRLKKNGRPSFMPLATWRLLGP